MAKAETGSESVADWPYGIAAPEQSMASPVSVQTTRVSAKTSKMPRKPCLTGSVSELEAWAMGAEPSPASFENTPRLSPQPSAPAKERGSRAETTMPRSTPGKFGRFAAMTARQQST